MIMSIKSKNLFPTSLTLNLQTFWENRLLIFTIYCRRLGEIDLHVTSFMGGIFELKGGLEIERRAIFLILFVLFWYKSFLNLVQKVTINFIISSELLESLLTKMNGWILFRIFWKERKTFSWNWRLLKQCLKVLWKVENWKRLNVLQSFVMVIRIARL